MKKNLNYFIHILLCVVENDKNNHAVSIRFNEETSLLMLMKFVFLSLTCKEN